MYTEQLTQPYDDVCDGVLTVQFASRKQSEIFNLLEGVTNFVEENEVLEMQDFNEAIKDAVTKLNEAIVLIKQEKQY